MVEKMIHPDNLPNRKYLTDPSVSSTQPLGAGEPESLRKSHPDIKIVPCDNPVINSQGETISPNCPYKIDPGFCSVLPESLTNRTHQTNGEAICPIPTTLTDVRNIRGYGWTRLIAIYPKGVS